MKQLLLTIFCLTGLYVQAQYVQLDASERQRLRALASDRLRCDTLNEWAFQRDGDDALPYARTALALAKQIGYAAGCGDAYLRLGQAVAHEGQYAQAEQFYRQSLEVRTKLHDAPGIGSCYNQLGLLKKKRGDYNAALVQYRLGLAQFTGLPAHDIEAGLHNNAGAAYRSLGRADLALQEFSQCLAVWSELRRQPAANRVRITTGMAKLRLNIAVLQQENFNQYAAAFDSLEICLADFQALHLPEYIGKCYLLLGNNAYWTGQQEIAARYYDASMTLQAFLTLEDKSILLKNRGRLLIEQRSYKQALKVFNAALDTFFHTENRGEIAATYYEIGNVHYEQNSTQAAIEAYKKALSYEPQDPIVKSHVLYFLSSCLDDLGRHDEASAYSSQYIALLSNLDSLQTRSAFEQLMQYQLAKDRLKHKLVAEERKTQLAYASSGISVLALMVVLIGFYARSNHHKRRLAEQKAQILAQEKVDLLRDLELDTYSAWLEGQEETQQKIGTELHDGLGSLLSTVKLHFNSIQDRLGAKQVASLESYEKANGLLEFACEEVRRISHELSSATLMKFGLKAQLEALTYAIGSSGQMKVELSTYGLDDRLDNKIELNVYRMIQLLTHNVIEHARASKITIAVNRLDHLLNVMVEDDGQGFSLEEARQRPGLGLKNLAARVHELDGQLHFDTQPGNGSRVSIDLPMSGD